MHFFTIDDIFTYWNFYLDFGPLNLGQLFRFCQIMSKKLRDPALAGEAVAQARWQVPSSCRSLGLQPCGALILACASSSFAVDTVLPLNYENWADSVVATAAA